uniref:MITD1 C-terminal phospholipase D-like domain-containing protein n=1 Tax=Parascaris equorum TaxID=6256 RepID=A0A914RCX1_PAREQ
MEAVAKYVEGISLLMEAMTCSVSFSSFNAYLFASINEPNDPHILNLPIAIPYIPLRTGHGYDKIFAKCMDDALSEVNVEDAYIIAHHQILNFVRFCEFCVLHARNLRRIR